MSYKDKPQIKLYAFKNNAFTLQAIIDDYQECSFENNYYQAGQFSITINYNIPNANKFQKGLFVQFGNDPYDFGEIKSISDSIGSDGKGSQNKVISGYDCRYLFKRRVIKNLNNNDTWQMTDKGEICLRSLIYSEAGEGTEEKRRLPITNIIPERTQAIGKEYSVSESFTNLYDVLCTIATQSEFGWRIRFENNSLTLECYSGEDKSATIQFSTDFESLSNGTFTDSAENFSNAIYIGGKGDGSLRDIYEGENEVEGSSPSGFDRFESWDDQSDMNTESEYEAEALSMLNQYGQTLTVSGNGLAKSPYIYKRNYDVGDIIKIAFSGKSANVQILSVTEHWTGRGSYGITFTFGKPINDLSDQLKLILRKIQIASGKNKTIDSVKWYDISTETEMPSADVTFNTIGFTGAIASGGSTFTLYLDDEGTGAKGYNIYAKNLTGTDKLTITSGVEDSDTVELTAGNYVGQLYVDEEGNVFIRALTSTNTIQTGNPQPATSGAVADAINSISLDVFDVCHPIGEKYIQLGGDPYPWELYTVTTREQWQNISSQYANEYFRVVGGEKPMGYFLTEDTEIVAGKTYYTRSGTDPNYTYTAVASPVVANIGTYYELSTNLTASTINNGDSDYLHEVQQEGLPNFTGAIECESEGLFNGRGNLTATGAFRLSKTTNWAGGDNNVSGRPRRMDFDASWSNPIYGSSEHVTALNSAIQIWKRIS